MISKYSKQIQIKSTIVIYFTFEYLIWTREKVIVPIQTEAKKYTYSKGKVR